MLIDRAVGDSRRWTGLLALSLGDAELPEYWCEADPTLRGRLSLLMHTGSGAASSAEEVVLVLEGEAEVTAGDEELRLTAGGIALVPALVPHDIRNVGQTKLSVVGFISSAAVISHFDETLAPFGTSTLTIGTEQVG